MKKPAAALCIVLSLVCCLLGQKADKPKLSVIWSPDADCHPNNTSEVKALGPRCSTAEADGSTFYIVNFGGVSYAMAQRTARDFLVASVQISNKSEEPIQVNPLRSKVIRFKTVDEFLAKAKGDSFSARSQDDLRQASYSESSYIGEGEGGIRPGLRVEERYEDVVDKNGKVVSRTTRLEPTAPATSKPAPSRIRAEVAVPLEIFDNVLKSRILNSGEKAAGHVVFKDSEKRDYVVFFMNAGPLEFVFPTVR